MERIVVKINNMTGKPLTYHTHREWLGSRKYFDSQVIESGQFEHVSDPDHNNEGALVYTLGDPQDPTTACAFVIAWNYPSKNGTRPLQVFIDGGLIGEVTDDLDKIKERVESYTIASGYGNDSFRFEVSVLTFQDGNQIVLSALVRQSSGSEWEA